LSPSSDLPPRLMPVHSAVWSREPSLLVRRSVCPASWSLMPSLLLPPSWSRVMSLLVRLGPRGLHPCSSRGLPHPEPVARRPALLLLLVWVLLLLLLLLMLVLVLVLLVLVLVLPVLRL
jgi:hypothetical protein